MSKGTVLQSVDSIRRDLEWRVYMAYKLSNAGYDSVIGPKEDVRRIHAGSRNCIFLGRLDSNTGRMDVDVQYLKDMEKRNTSLYFLHDEGALYFSGEYEEAVKRIYPEEYFGLPVMKRVLFWGDKQKCYFADPSYQDKLLVTGFPRFDLYQTEYSDMDKGRLPALQGKYGDYVLVCGRFAAVNTVPDDPGYLSKRLYDIRVEGGSLNTRTRDEILVSMFESWEKAAKEFASFLPAIAKLAMENPDINFVVRPHPAERESVYRESLSHFGNVFIDKSGDVRPFVRAAKLVIHSECTTGIEAEIAKVPNINYRPCMDVSAYSPYTVSGVNDVGYVVKTYPELSQKVADVIAGGFTFEPVEMGVQDYIVNVLPEVNAADEIVKVIAENHGSDSPPASLLAAENLASYASANIKLKLKKIIKSLLGWLGYSRFNMKAFSEGDLKNVKFDSQEIASMWEALGGDPGLIKSSSGVIYVKASKG